MTLLSLEILGGVIVASSLGLATSRLIWARELDRAHAHYRARLHRARKSWDAVEGRLTFALEELRVVRAELLEYRRREASYIGSGGSMVGRAFDFDTTMSVDASHALEPETAPPVRPGSRP